MATATRERTPRAGPPKVRPSRLMDRLFRGSTLGVALGLIGLLVLMILVLGNDGRHVFARFGFHFITGKQWDVPHQQFGALPAIFGTLVTSAIALVLGVPVAVGLAILLNEASTGWIRNILAVLVDLLAAVPSVVYGLWGVFVMLPVFEHHVEPFLRDSVGKIPLVGVLFHGNTNSGSLFSAGVILAIMILPIVTAVSREVLSVVPKELREGAMALGATRYETVRMAVLPYARSGLLGATMLGLGRALGETIAVVMVVGNSPFIHPSLFSQGYTIPAVIANEFREASSVGLHRSALLGLALILMVIALFVAAVSRLLVRRTAAALGAQQVQEPPEALALRSGGGLAQ